MLSNYCWRNKEQYSWLSCLSVAKCCMHRRDKLHRSQPPTIQIYHWHTHKQIALQFDMDPNCQKLYELLFTFNPLVKKKHFVLLSKCRCCTVLRCDSIFLSLTPVSQWGGHGVNFYLLRALASLFLFLFFESVLLKVFLQVSCESVTRSYWIEGYLEQATCIEALGYLLLCLTKS